MPKSQIRVNPKLLHRLVLGAENILNDRFTEVEIRELLIDLREIIRELHKSIKDLVKDEYLLLLDICDTIAHPHRERSWSPLIQQIGITSAAMQERIEENTLILLPESAGENRFDFALPTELRLANTQGLVFYMAAMIQAVFILLKIDGKYKLPFEDFMRRKADISLCIFSLLQHVTLHVEYDDKRPVQDGESGFLYLFCRDNVFHLYFRSYNTKLVRDSEQRAIKKGVPKEKLGSAPVSFCVLQGLDAHDDGTFVNNDDVPAVLETFRDDLNNLRIRNCDFG